MAKTVKRLNGFFGACLIVGLAATHAMGESARLSPALLNSSIGVTRKGTSIDSIISKEDFDLATEKVRVLIVGGLDGSSKSSDAARQGINWFQTVGKDRRLDKRFVLSVIPNANPDAAGGKPDNGSGGNPTRGYPPQGDAYNSPTDPEAAYLWRWIGMHAPDLVVVVYGGDQHHWSVPVCEDDQLKKLAKSLRSVEAKKDPGGLEEALVKHAPCETGTIPALSVTIGKHDGREYLAELFAALDQIEFKGPSPARRELQRRVDRSARQVASQLTKHYGHNLSQVAYIPALALIGRLRVGELVNDDRHLKDVRRIVQPYFSGDKPTSPKSGSHLSGHLVFCELADRTKGRDREPFIELARNAADLAFDKDGSPKPSMPFHSEMSDALFMGGPILTRVGKLTGDAKYFDACARHIEFMRKLVLRKDGLYRHSPLDEAAWGRGNGFPALGLAMCLSDFPANHPGHDKLLKAYQSHMKALAKHQDPNGCWHQVIDRPESYRELTSTSMITFAMIRGVRRGWLEPENYGPVINRAWYAIRTRVPSNGRLVDVCTGTGKQKNLRAYYDRTAILGPDARGGAMALMVATEMAAWQAETISEKPKVKAQP